jgi:hypothetical protein
MWNLAEEEAQAKREERERGFLARTPVAAPATPAQRKLVEREVVKVFGEQGKDISAFSTSVSDVYNAFASPGEVMLCRFEDYNYRLAVLYHEFGHIAQHMGIADDLGKDWQMYQHYIEVGANAIDTSGALEKWVNLRKSAYRAFSPGDASEEKLERDRKIEAQADLFSFRKLFEQKRITPLIVRLAHWFSRVGIPETESLINSLQAIYTKAKQPSEEFLSTHPLYLARALALAGFLTEHGIDVNKELKKWEDEGMCIDTESLPPEHWPELG